MFSKRVIVVLALLITISVILVLSSYSQEVFSKYAGAFGEYLGENKFLGSLVFVGLSALAAFLSPLSSVPLVPSAILAWGDLRTFVLLFTGWMIGGIIAYYIGYYTRKKFIDRMFSLEKVEYYQQKISPRSQFLLVLLFRLAVPSEVASYTLGIIRYNFSKYLLATLLAECPFAFFVIYSGLALARGRFIIFVVLLIFGSAALYFVYKKFNDKIKTEKQL